MRIAGPLQSWGVSSKHHEKQINSHPTKSGIIGMIACCMGIERNEDIHHLILPMGIGVIEHGKIIETLQTIGGGYSPLAPLKNGVAKADGEINDWAILTTRYYLCDADFLVAIKSNNKDMLECIKYALENPFWIPFLGRKSCLPSAPLFFDLIDSDDIEESLVNANIPCIENGSSSIKKIKKIILETPKCNSANEICYDIPVKREHGIEHAFAPRYVHYKYISQQGGENVILHKN